MKDLSEICRRVEAKAAAKRGLLRSLTRDAEMRARDAAIAVDYLGRLAEKARFRRLLADESQDGLRFRFYFSRMRSSEMSLDQIRSWIDSHMRSYDNRDRAAPTAPG